MTHGQMLAELRTVLGDKRLPFTLGHRVAISDAIDSGRPVWHKIRGERALRAARRLHRDTGEVAMSIKGIANLADGGRPACRALPVGVTHGVPTYAP
ncbi:MAG: ATPase involved in chromosome partitioning [Chromatiaceae bacterium]|nr:ATPase involved in chromosome partitioning [Chromatiaceae bacterium]